MPVFLESCLDFHREFQDLRDFILGVVEILNWGVFFLLEGGRVNALFLQFLSELTLILEYSGVQ